MPDPHDLRGVVLFRLADEVAVVHQWTLPDDFGMCMRVLVAAGSLVLAVFEGAKLAIFCADTGARLWAGDVPHRDTGDEDDVRAAVTAVCFRAGVGAVASSGKQVWPFAFARDDGAVQWASTPIMLPHAGVSDVALRPSDGRVLVAAGWDGRVRMFGVKPGHQKALCVCAFHTANVHCVAFAPADCAHANVFAAASTDRRISLWQLY